MHNLSVHQDAVLCLESHPSEPVVVTGAMDGTCVVVHVETGKTLATLSGHAHEVPRWDHHHHQLPPHGQCGRPHLAAMLPFW